jgi:hypothetical protein
LWLSASFRAAVNKRRTPNVGIEETVVMKKTTLFFHGYRFPVFVVARAMRWYELSLREIKEWLGPVHTNHI